MKKPVGSTVGLIFFKLTFLFNRYLQSQKKFDYNVNCWYCKQNSKPFKIRTYEEKQT